MFEIRKIYCLYFVLNTGSTDIKNNSLKKKTALFIKKVNSHNDTVVFENCEHNDVEKQVSFSARQNKDAEKQN